MMQGKIGCLGLLLCACHALAGASEVEFKGIVLGQDRATALAVASTMGADWVCFDQPEHERGTFNIGRSYYGTLIFPAFYPQGYEADEPVLCGQRGGGIRIGGQIAFHTRMYFVHNRLQYLEMEFLAHRLPLVFEAMQVRYGKPKQEQTRAGLRYRWQRGRDFIFMFPALPADYGRDPGAGLVGFMSQDAIDAQVARDKAVRAKELAKARSDW